MRPSPEHIPQKMRDIVHPRSLKHLSHYLQAFVERRLWLKVVIGMVLGVLLGVALGPSADWVSAETARVIAEWLALPGRLFLAVIQMIVIPLIFASIIGGLAAGEDTARLKKLGLSAAAFFVVTTAAAIVLGIALAIAIKPGRFVDPVSVRTALGAATPAPPAPTGGGASVERRSIPEAIVGLIPENPLGSMVESEMLQVVVFAIVLGVAIVTLPKADSSPVLLLLNSLQKICMAVVQWAMRLAPFAVFGLMARLTSKLGVEALLGLGVYVLTVLAGLLVLLAGYLLITWLGVGHSPRRFLRVSRDVLLLAFSTSSSAAVMPLSIKTAEEGLHVRSSTAQVVIPLGATVNMAGTALYQGVATIFLAQVFGIHVGPATLAVVVVTAVAASIGSPATPGVGIVVLATVLQSAGIPAAGIALIMGVDRILDMARTTLNVTGDLAAASVLDRLAGSRADDTIAHATE